MSTLSPKADYVRRNGKPDGKHTCHWPGCTVKVSPAMWGCRHHWFQLPDELRSLIWRTYRPGQEISKDPSDAYVDAAQMVQTWIREHGQ